MVVASPCAALIVGTGQDGHAKNTARGNITKDLDDAKYLSLPLSLVSPFIGDQEVLDAHIGDPVLCKPTNCGGQALFKLLAPLGGTHIMGAGQDGHARIAPRVGISDKLNFSQYSSLHYPSFPM